MWCGLELLMFFGLLSTSQLYFSWVYIDRTVEQDTGTGASLPMLCYFSMDPAWPDNGTLHPGLNATLCSHIIFIATTIVDCQITLSHKDDATKYFGKIPLLRKLNPDLKFLVSNGGGSSLAFSPVLGSAANRTRFVQAIFPFLRKYGLDGLDVDWEFPGWRLPVEQRKHFTMLLQQIRDAFDDEGRRGGKRYLLSAAVAAGRSVMEIYDVPALAKSLDWINLMCYDYHSYNEWTPYTDYNSPLYPTDWWKRIVITSGNIGWSSYEWHRRGMPKAKIMVGLPTYAHTFTLEKPEYHGRLAPAVGPGKIGSEASYSWVCDFLASGATEVFDEDAFVPYAYRGNQWISYDNVKSLTKKVEWIKRNHYGGVMVFDMSDDDYMGTCGTGRFPLISAMRRVLDNQQHVHS